MRDRVVLGEGFNRFPPGVLETPERYNDRPVKYKFVVHAESWALNMCEHISEDTVLYTTCKPCSECAKEILLRGLKRVVWSVNREYESRCVEDLKFTDIMFREAGILTTTYEPGF